MENPLVSLVITTKNESRNIKNCILSIQNQNYENIEIIVVDNNSDDDTKNISLQYTDKVFDKGPERSAQRNFGMIDKANGKYVMFIDADMILSPDVVGNCVQTIKDGDFKALWISEIILGTNFFSRCRRFERSFYDSTVIDGARFFDKQSFVQVGGFDENMSGPEDWDIDLKIKEIGKIGMLKPKIKSYKKTSRINQKIFGYQKIPVFYKEERKNKELKDFIVQRGVNPQDYNSVIYHNEADFKLGKYLKKKGYYSQSFENYINKRGKDHPAIRKQFGLYYRYFGVFLEDGKRKKLISHPLLTLGMYFLRFLVGVVYIFKK